MEYTKGKWKREYRRVVSDRGVICDIPLSVVIDGKQREANAQLIAKAPKLYEALNDLVMARVLKMGKSAVDLRYERASDVLAEV